MRNIKIMHAFLFKHIPNALQISNAVTLAHLWHRHYF